MQTDDIVRSENNKETVPNNNELKSRKNGLRSSVRNIVQVISILGEPSSPLKKTWKKRSLPRPLSTGQLEQTIHVLDTMANIGDKVALDPPDTELNAESQNAKVAVFSGASVVKLEDEKAARPKPSSQHVKHKYKTKPKASIFQPPMPLELIEAQKKIHSKGSCANPCWFQTQGKRLLTWLTVLSITVLYNLWFVIARQAFTDLQERYTGWWITMDLCADTIYVVDIIVQMGTTYLEHGLRVLDRRKLAMRYIYTKYFFLDLVALVPLDLIQFQIGVLPILRFPRFIKVYRANQWKNKIENRSTFPNFWRVIILIHILFLGFHWFACIYYIISAQQGFSTEWGYVMANDSTTTTGRTYLVTFYWATLALTTIGIEEHPKTNTEFAFTCLSYLIGLFVFATVVGQVGNIINARNAARVEFEEILDGLKSYMRMHTVDAALKKRILRWCDYAWQKRKGSGVRDINALEILPDRLKTELALDVNLDILKRVRIFRECEPEFLHDLVLKMRSRIFTPNDYICRKDEIARELFIIADGVLEVVGPNEEIWSRMRSGDYFGEIGILNISGQNRRTADVRAVGYADLFVLSRQDVLDALRDHPDAEVSVT
ncbi:Cyclic nucleotide-gated cation channel alpha-3 [Paragonimus heterotremus]|uniref:Cyclic nucleotide-gated cation channel alpha-3 n=1 Tax=Paragonimus heterotremus TaxID=100268 RepID=A0A8J4SV27_9TREM|nr:Cyclic nucleotide-gated cation channel alpha-3 [Paragonimus heterotremus]